MNMLNCVGINQTTLSFLAACIGGLFSLAGAIVAQHIQFKNQIRFRYREDKKKILLNFYNFLSKHKSIIISTADATNLRINVYKMLEDFDNDADFVFYISNKWLKKDFDTFRHDIREIFDEDKIVAQDVMINKASELVADLQNKLVEKVDKRG